MRVFEGTGFDFAGLADVEDREVVLLFLLEVGELLHGDLGDVVELVAGVNPAGDAAFEVGVDVLDADAGEAELGFAELIGVFADEDDAAVEAEDAGGPGGVLAGERDVDGAGHVSHGELHGGTGVEDDGAFGLEAEDLGCVEGDGWGELVDGGGALAVELDVAAEVLGARGQAVGEEVDELVLRAREEGVVGAALLADGGGALGAHLAAAERASSVGGEDLGVVGELEEFFVEALVEQGGELLRGVVGGEVGAAYVAYEESVAGEDGSGLRAGEARSVRTTQTPSMVWPGVWRKSKRALPNWRVSPSLMAVWGKVAWASSPR